MATMIDYQDAKIEHLSELGLAKKYDEAFPEGCFIDNRGRQHDHSCCPDCCGCDDDYAQYLTLEEYMKGF